MHGGRTPRRAGGDPGEGPRWGARGPIVWACAPASAVLCVRGRGFACCGALGSPAAAPIGRSSSESVCCVCRGKKEGEGRGENSSQISSSQTPGCWVLPLASPGPLPRSQGCTLRPRFSHLDRGSGGIASSFYSSSDCIWFGQRDEAGPDLRIIHLSHWFWKQNTDLSNGHPHSPLSGRRAWRGALGEDPGFI